MKTEVTGTIVAGVPRLDEPIDLPDNSRVRGAVELLEDPGTAVNSRVPFSGVNSASSHVVVSTNQPWPAALMSI
jgi:hypothetical protein